MTVAAPPLSVGPVRRSTRDRLFGDRPWWVVLVLGVVAAGAAVGTAFAGLWVAFSGWMGSDPAPAIAYVAFVAGFGVNGGVAVAYWKVGRALLPTVLMAVGAVALLLPLWGAVVGLPCVLVAILTSFVGPVARMRHRRVVGACVVGALALLVLVYWFVATTVEADRARQDSALAVQVVLARQAAGDVALSGTYDSGDELSTTDGTTALTYGHIPLVVVATDHEVCVVSRDPVRGVYHGHDTGGRRAGRSRDGVCPLASAATGFSIDYPVGVHVSWDGSAVPVVSGGRAPYTFRLSTDPLFDDTATGGTAELPQGVTFDPTTGVFLEDESWTGQQGFAAVVVEVTDADGLTVRTRVTLT
ncbi:hypothetical protein Cch01nite_42980 [Cellulomonas chitinilytica]|uniref:Uncharacterized protein n=1 Tax=Cellulomonas chitinilytica TaxID=398759 RepID=A0A919U4W9_9CELL|nr:Ig domain-containing protein [Cellulomonas chitinilytica]GIG23574.1 hypothetical protein Cch01nite_42980 [Cellulomonas chitinilytica]